MAAATYLPKLPEPSSGFRHPRKPDDIFIRQSKAFQRPINSDGSLSTPELYFDDSDDSPFFTGISPMPPSSVASSYGSSPYYAPSYPMSPGVTLILSPSTSSDSDDDVMEFFQAAAYPGPKSWKSSINPPPVAPRTPSPEPVEKPRPRGLPSPVTPKAWTSHEEPPPLPTLPTLKTTVYQEKKPEAPPPLSLNAMVYQGIRAEESPPLPTLNNTVYQGVKAGGTTCSSIKIVDVKKPATLQKKPKATSSPKAKSSPRSRSASPRQLKSTLGDIAENPPGRANSQTRRPSNVKGRHSPSPPIESPFQNIMVTPPVRATSPPLNSKGRSSPTIQESRMESTKDNPPGLTNSPATRPSPSQGRSSPSIPIQLPKSINEDPPGLADSIARKKTRAKHQISVRTMEALAPVLKSPMEIPTLIFSEPDDDDESEAAMTDFEDMDGIENQTISKKKLGRRRSKSATGVIRTPEQSEYNRFLKPLPKVPQQQDFFPAPLKPQSHPHPQPNRDIAIASISRDLTSLFYQDPSSSSSSRPTPIPLSSTTAPQQPPALMPLPTQNPPQHRPKMSLYPAITTTPPPQRARSASPPRSPALIHRDQLHGASFSPTKSPRTVVQHWLMGVRHKEVGREKEKKGHGVWGRNKMGRREEVWI